MKPVLTKADFVRRYRLGEFGNHSPTWDTIEEFSQAHVCIVDAVHLRNRVAGGVTHYNITAIHALSLWASMPKPDQWYCSRMAPTEHTLIQGEVGYGVYGYDLTWSWIKKPMRDALREQSEYLTGVGALFLLREYLCKNSLSWLMHLLNSYEDHVVEFSTYSMPWGTVPEHNTIFWEVRKY